MCTWSCWKYCDIGVFLTRLRYTLKCRTEDSWRWIGTSSGRYSTREAYEVLTELRARERVEAEKQLGFKLVWKNYAPLKVKAHAWRLLWDRLPTMTNLARRNIHVNNGDTRCVLCGLGEESARHIFFECSISHKVWMDCFKWLNTPIVLHHRALVNLISNSRILRGKVGKLMATTLWLCVVWRIWKERNDIIFNNGTCSVEKIVVDIKVRLWS